jgi:hypothetical protein
MNDSRAGNGDGTGMYSAGIRIGFELEFDLELV